MSYRQSALSINKSTTIAKDEDGFDDIDEYWSTEASCAISAKKNANNKTPKSKNTAARIEEGIEKTPRKTPSVRSEKSVALSQGDAMAVGAFKENIDNVGSVDILPPFATEEGHVSIETDHDDCSTQGFGDNGDCGDQKGQSETMFEEDDEISFNHAAKPYSSNITDESTDQQLASTAKIRQTTSSSKRQTFTSTRPSSQNLKAATVPNSESSPAKGLRRGKRRRFEPLKYWKNDRVMYGRRESSLPLGLPVIVDIEKSAPTPPSKKVNIGRTTKKALKAVSTSHKLKAEGPVTSIETGEEVTKTLALSADMVKCTPMADSNCRIHSIFSEGDFMTSGVLLLPIFGEKPVRNANKSALVFYVISGALEVSIGRTDFVAAAGTQFLVPRGNQYSLRNVGTSEARLFYCHCRDNTL